MIKFKMKEIMDVKNQAKQLDMFHCFLKKKKKKKIPLSVIITVTYSLTFLLCYSNQCDTLPVC